MKTGIIPIIITMMMMMMMMMMVVQIDSSFYGEMRKK